MRSSNLFALSLPAILASVLLLPGASHAMPLPNPRDPQVPIVGGGLQAYLDARGQEIDVHTDQDAIQSWEAHRCPGTYYTVQLELRSKSDGASIGFYDATAATPSLNEVFPPQAGVGWTATVAFHDSPAQVIVALFTESYHHVGTTTYLGGNRNSVGFYLHGPGGDLFTQDARNLAGDPQFLSFLGTGSYAGGWWSAAEETPLNAGADRDFDDMILFVYWQNCSVPVQRSTWGEVKSRFQ